jgi:spermidine/putrescine transport system ATP-binding protein
VEACATERLGCALTRWRAALPTHGDGRVCTSIEFARLVNYHAGLLPSIIPEGRMRQPDVLNAGVSGKDAIEFREVIKSFPDPAGMVYALDGVSLAIRSNEFFTLLGPSGCGKTTLLRLIAGFEEPSAGEVRIDGESVLDVPPHRRLVNTVFQNYALFPHMSVAENVDFGQRMRGIAAPERRARTNEMLALVQLEGVGDRRPDQLSGGQQQRVALARALANHPKVLLLDEPLSALDYKLRKEMRLELKRLQRETGITFIFVTHDQEEALEMSDRLAVMSNGRVQQVDTPAQVYDSPVNRFVADFIGETNFLEATIESRTDDGVVCRIARDQRITATGGGEEGLSVTLAVRPEKALLYPPGDPEQRLAGRVVETVYQGSHTSYHVDLGDGQRLIARAGQADRSALAFTLGDPVALHLAPGSARVVE